MQVDFITIQSLPKTHNGFQKTYNKNISNPTMQYSTNVVFTGTMPVTRTVSSKIAHEKDKILKRLKDILSTNTVKKTHEDLMFEMATRAHALINMRIRRQKEIEVEMQVTADSTVLNPQQKYEIAQKLMKEYKRLEKLNPFEKPKKETKIATKEEHYDYALINKFKDAVLNNQYNFTAIYAEHYSDLEHLSTVEEVKEKYPYMELPVSPEDIIVKKIIETLPRSFFVKLDSKFDDDTPEALKEYLYDYLKNISSAYAKLCDINDVQRFLDTIGLKLTQKIFDIYENIIENKSFFSIPAERKNKIPAITDLDRMMLNFDYDSYALFVLRQLYIEGKKPNEIVYIEGDKQINVSSLKSTEYKVDKLRGQHHSESYW